MADEMTRRAIPLQPSCESLDWEGPLALNLLDFQSRLVSVEGDANQGDRDCWSELSVNLYAHSPYVSETSLALLTGDVRGRCGWGGCDQYQVTPGKEGRKDGYRTIHY